MRDSDEAADSVRKKLKK